MDEQEVLDKIKEISKSLPKFDDGRINYSNSNIAPVITVFVKYEAKLLLLKRSNNVATYKGKWNSISGYLDRVEPLKKKVFEELQEEIGIDSKDICKLIVGKPYEIFDKEIGKTWLVCPFITELNKQPNIILNFEHIDYRWIAPEDLKNFDIVVDLEKSYLRCI